MSKDGREVTEEEFKRAAIRRQQRWAARQLMAQRSVLQNRDFQMGRQLELRRQLDAVQKVEIYRKVKVHFDLVISIKSWKINLLFPTGQCWSRIGTHRTIGFRKVLEQIPFGARSQDVSSRVVAHIDHITGTANAI